LIPSPRLLQIFKVVSLPHHPLPATPPLLLHVQVRTHHHMNAHHQVHPVLALIPWRRIMQRPPSCARAIDFSLVLVHCLSNHLFFPLLTQESHSSGIIWTMRKSTRIPSLTAHTLNNKPCSRTQASRFGAAPLTHLPVVTAPRILHQGMRLTFTIFINRHVHPHNSPRRLPEVQALATEAPRLGVLRRLNGMSCPFPLLHRKISSNLPLGWYQSPIQHSITQCSHKLSHPP
jgi:hypothetical protein